MTANNKQFLKKKLPAYIKLASSLSLVVGAMGAATQVYAQSDSADGIEEIIVTGQRASIQSAQAIKRESEVVVDSVTAVDIGALPDRSVSEALQRIPGVQLQRTNENRDPARLAAEGGAVFVRGLSWVRTELNGRDIFSASNGRSLGFEDVSADLMSGVDVYKSPAANMVEGGIGGTVNLRTRLPFDATGQVIAGSVDYNYAELYDKGFPSANALYSNRWDTGIGEIGFLISASKAEIGNRTDSIQTGRYIEYNVSADENVVDNRYLPQGLGFRRIDWEQERNAYAAAIQWAPNEEFTLTLQALKTEANPEDVERAAGLNGAGGGDMAPYTGDYEYDSEGFLYRGVMRDAAYSLNTRYGKKETGTEDYSVNFKYEPDDHWTFSGDLQYVTSEATVLSSTSFTQLGATDSNSHSGVDAYFDFGGVPSLYIDSADRQAMQSEYWWAAAMDHIEDNEADSISGRLDADYKFDEGSFVRGMVFGVRTTDRDTITRQSGWNWGFLSNQFWGGAGTPDQIAHLDDYAASETELYKFDNFFRGSIDAPGVGWFPKVSLMSNTAYAYEQLKSTQTSGWGWTPLEAPAAYDLDPRSDNVSAGINEQNEKTAAGYVMVRFGDDTNDILGVPFDGNIGVRVVQTDTTAYARSGAGGVGEGCAGSSSADCVGAAEFVTAFNEKFGDYTAYSNSYTNVLPSFNLRLLVADDVQVRFGASRAMVRPSFSQTQPYSNLSFGFLGDKFDPSNASGTQGSGTAGAPNLKATLADQLDASVEYYFTDTSSLTFSAFYKKLSDYITASTIVDQYTAGGRTYDFEVTRQINASEGKLKGFEVAYQQFFDKLPEPFDGLGIQTNFTYIDNTGGANTAVNVFDSAQFDGATSDALPVEGMSKTSYNFALMYEKYDVSARLAYNWRERYLLTTSAANINRPVWFADYGQLDGSVFYNLTENVKIGLQVTNLLAERTTLEVGDTKLAGDYSWTEGDRRAAFVVRAQF
jgi:TonB-dependent receptor